jgi:6-phosphogluconate dehydrogenase
MKDTRLLAAKAYPSKLSALSVDKKQAVKSISHALYASKICSYAQGFHLIATASKEFKYGVDLKECARIWKGGCIIRAVFLDKIRQAFEKAPELPNLLLDEGFRKQIEEKVADWRAVVGQSLQLGVLAPAMSASLAYFDALRRERLPANIIQAQRDFFGAHTYERTDKPGSFHTLWTSEHHSTR